MPIPIFPTASTIQTGSGLPVSSTNYNSSILDQLNRYNLFFAWLATGLESDTVADGGVLSQNVLAKYEDVTEFINSNDYVQKLDYRAYGNPGQISDALVSPSFTTRPTLNLTELATFKLSKFNGDKAMISLYLELLFVEQAQSSSTFKKDIEISLYEKSLLSDSLTTPIKTYLIKTFDVRTTLVQQSFNTIIYTESFVFITPLNSSSKYYTITAKIINPKVQQLYSGGTDHFTTTTIKAKPEFITVKYI
jgi:hypothetical protein